MINFYKGKLCLNCLAKDIDNANQILEAIDNNALVGVLSADYNSVEEAVKGMNEYKKQCDNNISVGLGGGNPAQWKMVAEISKEVLPKHINQIFSAVGYTRASVCSDEPFINALVSPCGKEGYVKVSTGPLSKDEDEGIVPIDTAIAMIREIGGNSIKYFPMKGLACKNEFIEVAKACARNKFVLEPTGGIDLNNLEEILKIALDQGVEHIIVHVYTSIIDDKTGTTKIEDVKKIYEIFKKLV